MRQTDNALRNFALNCAWMFKILTPFFAVMVGLGFLVFTALSVLHIVTGEKVPGRVADVKVEYVNRPDGPPNEVRTVTVSYMKNDSATTAPVSVVGHYKIGEEVPLLVSEDSVRIGNWGELFTVSIVLGIFLVMLTFAYWILSKMKYEPKEWSYTGIAWMFKGQD
jgi:hypothetical protein